MSINIGNALKTQRENAGLNIMQLSKQTGISRQNLSRWEANEVAPNIFFCIQLAKFYKITIEELIGI